jgi:CBS domain containing-hemolysin-like protein
MELIATIAILLFLMGLLVVWVGFASSLLLISRYELKKRAQTGDIKAKIIYALTIDGREILIALLLGSVLVITLIALLFDSFMWSLLAAVCATLLVGVGGILLPFAYGEKLGLNVTAKLAPLASKILLIMRPITRPLANMIDKATGKKSILYSKEQLLHIIEDHTKSPYADISADEARLVRHSLEYGSKIISDVMIPRKVVTMVSTNDQMGPVLMDELHKSGHSRFPVYDSNEVGAIVGTLYLHDLVGSKKSGAVKGLMSPKVFFVHEQLDLNHALDAFIKTKHHLFIVVNTFEEFVGILTIEDVLEQILGRQIVDEFDNYENLREVALLRANKERA